MNINIDGLRAAILTVGLMLYYFVHKHTVDRLSGSAGKGDIVGAICAAAAVVTMLWALFGGAGNTARDTTPPTQPSSVTTAPGNQPSSIPSREADGVTANGVPGRTCSGHPQAPRPV
ncbi:hypothetical protein [Streptomyces malaysiensis]|uniref:hypothetical protein n=1 Tax=Streptomyces malaysiensis TaxID=92644 RepID=UPI00372141CE